MPPRLSLALAWLRRRAENVVVALMALLFGAFIVQIVFRYVFNFPVGWTSELSVIAWLYIVLLGSALWLREGEEISFDLLTDAAGPRLRRLCGFIAAASAALLLALSLPATWKYVTFMKVESTAYLKIRLDLLYAVYIVFAVALVLRYSWTAWRHLRGQRIEQADVTERGYGL